jgi:cytochrome c oxidase subunit III
MTTATTTDVKVRTGGVRGAKGSGPGGGGPEPPDNNWPPGYSREDAIESKKYRIGMWVAIGSILMLFISLTSAYLVRQNPVARADEMDPFGPVSLPPILWVSSIVLILSSVTLEAAKRALRRNRYERVRNLICLTTALGAGFVAAQLLAWRQLVAQGVYVNSTPHSSFFYLLTGLHGVHLLGGIIALGILAIATIRLRIGVRTRNAVEVTTMYWHFMDVVWIWLFLLLFFWR